MARRKCRGNISHVTSPSKNPKRPLESLQASLPWSSVKHTLENRPTHLLFTHQRTSQYRVYPVFSHYIPTRYFPRAKIKITQKKGQNGGSTEKTATTHPFNLPQINVTIQCLRSRGTTESSRYFPVSAVSLDYDRALHNIPAIIQLAC